MGEPFPKRLDVMGNYDGPQIDEAICNQEWEGGGGQGSVGNENIFIFILPRMSNSRICVYTDMC